MPSSIHTCTASHQRCVGFPFPIRCPILTTVCSLLGFSPRERALSRVLIDSFLPAASSWPPGMISISRGARSQYGRAVICLCCCIRYITRCDSNHSIALFRCGGQNSKWGRRHQSAGMRRGSVRSICAILSLAHNQMAVRSLYSVSRCPRVSRLPQCLQRSNSTSLMTCRRSLVTNVSCTMMYHMDAISFDTHAVCRFICTCIHFVSVCICFILISRDFLVAAAIVCGVL